MTGQSKKRARRVEVPAAIIASPTNRTGSPQKRTRAAARLETIDTILKAAFVEFAANGYAATRLEDVARRAGVAKGLPSFYFRSKEDLFRAVVHHFIAPTWIELVDAAFATDAPSREVLRATLTTMYKRVVGDRQTREVTRLLIAEGPRFPELTQLYYDEVVERSLLIWRRIVERGIERGEFRADALKRYPQMLYGPALMATVWQLLFAPAQKLDLKAWIEAHLDLVLNGLEARNVR